MSGAVTAVVATAAAYSIYSGEKSRSAQEEAQKRAQQQAQQQANAASQDFNKANQKQPDTAAILSATQQAGKAGASGTMLTGSQGVDPNALALGKNTLLGQ